MRILTRILSPGRFLRSSNATAGIEFALLLPAMVSILVASIDLGKSLVLARKLVSATNTMADQAARYQTLAGVGIDEVGRSGEMVMRPYETEDLLGVDLISVTYDENDELVELCRQTANMRPEDRFPTELEDLGTEGQGVIGLASEYSYEPTYWGFATGVFVFEHYAIARSRTGFAIPCT